MPRIGDVIIEADLIEADPPLDSISGPEPGFLGFLSWDLALGFYRIVRVSHSARASVPTWLILSAQGRDQARAILDA